MNIYEKLLLIQQEVRATKDLRNDFGKFNYRNAEAIYEVAKPVCLKHKALLHVSDDIEMIDSHPYIKALAELIDVEKTEYKENEPIAISSVGWARIPDSLKGMNDCQVTGSSSSYARKYALSALLLLDDCKDPDSLDNSKNDKDKAKEKALVENKQRLDEEENWRLLNGNQIEVKTKKGWANLDTLELRWLEVMLNDPRFEGIKNFVQMYIDKIKGV